MALWHGEDFEFLIRRTVYKFYAETSTSVSPNAEPWKDADKVSALLHRGVRTWAFRTAEERQTFIEQVSEAGHRAWSVGHPVHSN